MKKKLIQVFCIGSFILPNVFASQPAEKGLLFNANLVGNRGIYKRGQNGILVRNRVQRQRFARIERYKEQSTGKEIWVFKTDVLPQFLYLATRQQEPIVIGIFNNIKPSNKIFTQYQEIAQKFKDQVLCIGIDKVKSTPVLDLLKRVLQFENICPRDFDKELPIFLFCHKDFVVLINGSVSFKKGNIKVLSKSYFDKDDLGQKIESMLVKSEKRSEANPLDGKGSISFEENSKQDKLDFFKQKWFKFKKWLKTRF